MGTIVNKTKHKEPTNQNDVEALQLHDSNSHEVNEKIFPNNPAAAVYKQEVDSNNPGKHYTHTHLITPYHLYLIKGVSRQTQIQGVHSYSTTLGEILLLFENTYWFSNI